VAAIFQGKSCILIAATMRVGLIQVLALTMPFFRLSIQASENLTSIAQRCLSVAPDAHRAWTFNTSILAADVLPLVAELKEWSRPGAYIYHFQCVGDPDLASALDAFRSSKLRDNGLRSYAKPNEVSPCLYVGGSKNIVTRLKQHLGYSAAKGTYSLQLLHWATSLSLDLTFSCARYGFEQPQDVLQALEDTLWDINRPMLGRRGAR
jgi:hypothetical protein